MDIHFGAGEISVVAILLGSVVGALVTIFKLLMASKDSALAKCEAEAVRAVADLESVKKSYQEIAADAIKSATETTNYYRARDGKPPLVMVAPVVSESHSPSTAVQRETALISTMRASVAAIRLATDQEPRQEPEHAKEDV